MTEAARIGTNLDRVLHYRRYADGSASAGDPVPFPVGVEAGGFEYNLYMAFAFQVLPVTVNAHEFGPGGWGYREANLGDVLMLGNVDANQEVLEQHALNDYLDLIPQSITDAEPLGTTTFEYDEAIRAITDTTITATDTVTDVTYEFGAVRVVQLPPDGGVRANNALRLLCTIETFDADGDFQSYGPTAWATAFAALRLVAAANPTRAFRFQLGELGRAAGGGEGDGIEARRVFGKRVADQNVGAVRDDAGNVVVVRRLRFLVRDSPDWVEGMYVRENAPIVTQAGSILSADAWQVRAVIERVRGLWTELDCQRFVPGS